MQQNKIYIFVMDSKIFPNLGFAYSYILFYHLFSNYISLFSYIKILLFPLLQRILCQ